ALLRAWQRLDRLGPLPPPPQSLAADTGPVAEDARALPPQGAPARTPAPSPPLTPPAGAQPFHLARVLARPPPAVHPLPGVYDGLHTAGVFVCREQDPEDRSRPAPVRLRSSWEIDLSQLETQRCVGKAMGQLAERLGVQSSEKASTLVGWLARAELAAWIGSSSQADQELARPEWSWLGRQRAPRDLGSLGIGGDVLLSQKSPCTERDPEALCISDIGFEQFLTSLREAGYKPESRAMHLAVEDPGQFTRQTTQRIVDRAATIELTSTSASEAATRKGVLFILSAGEVWTRGDVASSSVRLSLDPSTIPSVPLANGPEWAIWAAHAFPYRAALDVARG